MRRAALAALLAVAPALAAAWGGVRGNGEKTTTRRDVPAFTAVRLEESLDVHVRVGAPQSVEVRIDSNLQEHVRTEVSDGTLVIRFDEAVRYRGEGRVDVVVPSLTAFAIDGSGDVTIDGGAGGELALTISGSGDLRWSGSATDLRASIEGSGDLVLQGTAERLDADIEGTGDLDGARLTARTARVTIDGTGDARVHLGGGALRAEVNGTGEIRWTGDATVERARVNGTGSIVHG